ncbi:carbohydrate ABC transporter permease [Paenibacillus sp. MSJ-34]|uniref:carbohydrate ABC transporter permease n=1 Tax=Paenibacillus sp. MSJ-34 TaxID=2841529 RepID=UPI001C10F49F|nr:sugar ABC transporter permease [Paenibacillus sp. MSJ-34]MBU5442288.1 sugar ABC transporter permease [Paenibacillus sp. MSJ-34]
MRNPALVRTFKKNVNVRAPSEARKERLYKYTFMVPAVLFLTLLLIFPVAYTVWQSFHDTKLTNISAAQFIGLDNYIKLFKDMSFWYSLRVTLYFTALALLFQTVLGIGLALLYNAKFFGRGILRTLAIMPMAATPVSIALIFVMIYNPDLGVANYLLEQFGLPKSLWTYSESTVIPALALIDTWQWTPLLMIIALAGLASLPSDVYESAKIDGASAWKRFVHITMPLLWPFIASAIVFRLNDALKTFDVIYVMTQGGPGLSSTTLNILLYNQAFTYYNTGYASAQIVIFFFIVMAIAWFFIRNRKVEWK